VDGENTNMFSPRMWYLSLNTSTWSTAKKKEWHSPKTKQRQLKLFTPLLLVIKAFKKNSDLNSIHKSTTLTCQHISLFWEAEKRAGKLDKNISPMPSIAHAHFTCYEYVLKKFTALNYTNKRMTLACQFRALLPDSE
jgi:hypothetical protein